MNCFSTAEKIICRFEENGFDAYAVGGCVRDFLLGRQADDIDLCTVATPQQIKECFKDEKLIDTGEKHGTVTLLLGGESFEITTFRSEGQYFDNRHPSSVTFVKSIEEDLSRRDFTMNAIALRHGTVFDPFDGKCDIEKKLIRTVGNADERFCEDALRIMRALRFSSVLGFEIEQKTAEAIHKNKNFLSQVSVERLAGELCLLICGKNVEHILLDYSDVLAVFIPEILPCVGFDQHSPYHCFDVWTHIVKSVAAAPTKKEVRLAMFFHDMAKPACMTLDKTGRGHFKTHPEKSAELARAILHRLNFDSKTLDCVCFLIKNHYLRISADKPSVKMFLKTCNIEVFRLLLCIIRADNSAKGKNGTDKLKYADELEVLVDEIEKNNECFSLKTLAVNGSDLEKLGIKGEAIGKTLNRMLDAVISETAANDKQFLLSSDFLMN